MVAEDAVLSALLFFICCCASKREGKNKLLTPSKKPFSVLLSLLVAAYLSATTGGGVGRNGAVLYFEAQSTCCRYAAAPWDGRTIPEPCSDSVQGGCGCVV